MLDLDAVMRHMRRRADERDFRTTVSGGRRERETHLAARVVADESHRIDRLAGASNGHHDTSPPEVVTGTHGVRPSNEGRLRARPSPRSGVAAGPGSTFRL